NLAVRAKPSDIPVKLSVDVSPLEIGDVIHVSAIALPVGVTSVTGRDLAVVTCAAPEEEEKPETTAEGLPVEGAAPAGAAAPGATRARGGGGAARGAAARAGKDAKGAAAPAGKDARPAAPAAAPAGKDAKAAAPAGKPGKK